MRGRYERNRNRRGIWPPEGRRCLTWLLLLVPLLARLGAGQGRGQGQGQGNEVDLPLCPVARSEFDLPDAAACSELLRYVVKGLECAARPRPRCCPYVQTLLDNSCQCSPALLARPKAERLREASRGCLEVDPPIRVLVGVLTAAKNRGARAAVRETWGADDRLFRVLFFLARPREEGLLAAVRHEAGWYGDMVVLPTVWEHYHNITHQTLEILRMAAVEPSVTHVLKIDDDSYLKVDDLLETLEDLPRTRLLLGAIENPGGGPHRDPSSQWYVMREEWPSDKYPPWAHGAGYVISQDLVREVAGGAALQLNGGYLFKLEDVAVGSWLEHVALTRGFQLHLINDPRFSYLTGCHARDVVSHYIPPTEMRCIFRNGGKCCSGRALAALTKSTQGRHSAAARRRARRNRGGATPDPEDA